MADAKPMGEWGLARLQPSIGHALYSLLWVHEKGAICRVLKPENIDMSARG